MQPPTPTAPTKKRRKWPWITAGTVVLILVIAGIAGQDDATQPAAQSSGSTSTTAQAAPTTTTTTPAPTTTSPPPAPPVVKTGRGDDVVNIAREGVKVVRFECPRCTGNTALKTDGAESLLVNTIGKYQGQHWVDIRDGSVTTTYTINATGSWTLTVGGLDIAHAAAAGPVTGTGDDALVLTHKATKASITNKGEGNFAVVVVSLKGGLDLAVNVIGSYSGTVPFDTPALVQVNSQGSWTITPQA